MKLSKREIILLYVLIIALIVFVAVTFVIKPMAGKFSDLKEKREQLQTEYKIKQTEASSVSNIKKKIEELNAKIDSDASGFIESLSDTEFFRYMQNYIEAREFVLSEYVTSDKTSASGASVTEQTVSLVLTKDTATELAEAECESVIIGLVSHMKSAKLNTCSWNIGASGSTVNINFTVYSLQN